MLNDIKDAISSVCGDLPEAISEPVIQRLDIVGDVILTYAVSDVTQAIEELPNFVNEVISCDLQGANGVGKISRLGGADGEIKVELDPNRLLALCITASQVNAQLRSTNVDLDGGHGDITGQEFCIRVLGSVQTVAQLAALSLSMPSGQTVRLDQLGTVTDGASEARGFALYNGQPVLAFGVFRSSGTSDLDAGDATKEKLHELGENIQMGKSAFEAASEIGLTVVTISLTIVAVFVPVSFIDGIIGQFFRQFGLTVAVAVMFSLLVARLITPTMTTYFLKDGAAPEEAADGIIIRTYLKILKGTLGHRTVTLIMRILIICGIPLLRNSTATRIPSGDRWRRVKYLSGIAAGVDLGRYQK